MPRLRTAAPTAPVAQLPLIQRASTVAEFADRYRIHPKTVYLYERRGELTITRIGRSARILEQHEREWLARAMAQTEESQPARRAGGAK